MATYRRLTIKREILIWVVGLLFAGRVVAEDDLSEVVIAPGSQTFSVSVTVSMTCDSEGATIRFTRDGTAPSIDNGEVYTKPILLEKTTQLRVVAIRGDNVGKGSSAHFVHLSKDLAAHRSSLPIMVISTFENGMIPGKGWNQLGIGIKQVPRHSAAWMFIDYAQGTKLASLAAEPQLASRIGIRQRGAFSSTWNQKPYSVESWDETDDDLDVAPLGLPEDSDWVLYYPDPTPKKDKTLIYNAFMWRLSRKAGRYAPRFRFVEAFVNEDGGSLKLDDRRGIYVLVEKVKRGEKRLPFEKLSDDGKTGGWMISINRMDAEYEKGWPAPNGATSPQFFHTAGPDRVLQTPANDSRKGDDFPQLGRAQFNFESPSGYKIQAPQRAAIELWFKEFENVLYDDEKWLDRENGYRKHIDVIDFVDFHIFNNLAQNYDGLLLSIYPWLSSEDQKLRMGPTWDFNWDCYDESGSHTKSVLYQRNVLWFRRLFEDPDFMGAYLRRWEELRNGTLCDASLTQVVDELVAEIGEENATAQGIPDGEWSGRIKRMQSWLVSRAHWLDERFPKSPEFSIESGVVKSGAKLMIRSSSGQVRYTIDGTDPRSPSGGSSPTARTISATRRIVFLKSSSPATALVPRDGRLGERWTSSDFDDRRWLKGKTGVGYDEDATYRRLLGLDLRTVMAGKSTSAYVRIPFEVAYNPKKLSKLNLAMAYDDGFVAYLNGHRITSQNAPEKLTWDSGAASKGSDSNGITAVPFDVTDSKRWLQTGRNVLAIHGLNAGIASSDFLINPQLVGEIPDDSGAIPITGPITVTARTYESGIWSDVVKKRYRLASPNSADR